MNTGYIVGFAAAICVVCSLGVAGASMGLRTLIEDNEEMAFRHKLLAAVDIPPLDENGERDRLPPDQANAAYEQQIRMMLIDANGAEVYAGESIGNKRKALELNQAVWEAAVASKKDVGELYEERLQWEKDNPFQAAQEGQLDPTIAQRPSPLFPVFFRVKKNEELAADAAKLAADRLRTPARNEVEAYAIQMNGKGLWGPISGYMSLEPDGKTVMNVSFDAPKETPGLGAEIMNLPFKKQWAGKTIVEGKSLAPIEVLKSCGGGANPHCVDGVSGATITSDGVDNMVEQAVLVQYQSYLAKIQSGG